MVRCKELVGKGRLPHPYMAVYNCTHSRIKAEHFSTCKRRVIIETCKEEANCATQGQLPCKMLAYKADKNNLLAHKQKMHTWTTWQPSSYGS